MIKIATDKWKRTFVPPSLKDGEIDLWSVDLDRDSASISSLFELLSDDEKSRANKYVFAKDRTHFIACRATLRKILGGYLGVNPQKIRFLTGRYGKPFLAPQDCDLRFNVSHSQGLGVVAVSQNREIGVDIEYINRDFDVLGVAPNVFSAAEFSQMRLLSTIDMAAKFFAGWTRKEAFLKAMGDGLSSSDELQSVVSLISDEDVVYRSIEGGKVTDWSLTSFEIRENFKASLVVEGKIGTIRFWQLSECQHAK